MKIIIGIAAKNKTPTPLLKYVFIDSLSPSPARRENIGNSGTKNAVTKIPTGNWKILFAKTTDVQAPSIRVEAKNMSI